MLFRSVSQSRYLLHLAIDDTEDVDGISGKPVKEQKTIEPIKKEITKVDKNTGEIIVDIETAGEKLKKLVKKAENK